MSDTLLKIFSDPNELSRYEREWGVSEIRYHESVGSTQDEARAGIEAGAKEWTLIVADNQTAGRGQHGRIWFATPGRSLMFSLILRPANAEAMALLPIRCGIAIARALDTLCGCADTPSRTMLKWPNDLIVSDAKVGGVLCEGQVRGEDRCAIVGVGLNVRPFGLHPTIDIRPGFLTEILPENIGRFEILEAVIKSFRSSLDTTQSSLSSEELQEFEKRNWLFQKPILEPLSGIVEGITSAGHLKVVNANGQTHSTASGSVLLVESRR